MATVEKIPEYVTDGFHTYLYIEEFEDLLKAGKLKECEPPVPPKVKELSPREKAKLEEKRKQALKQAQDAVELFSKGGMNSPTSDDLFGSPPKSG